MKPWTGQDGFVPSHNPLPKLPPRAVHFLSLSVNHVGGTPMRLLRCCPCSMPDDGTLVRQSAIISLARCLGRTV